MRHIIRGVFCALFGFVFSCIDVDLSGLRDLDSLGMESVIKLHSAEAGRKRDRASARNRESCETWCKNNPNCEKCDTRRGCGMGLAHMETWGGFGDNWHACKKNRYGMASDENKRNCNAWCKKNEYCERCDTRRGCGRGLKQMETWGGRGENWHACEKKTYTLASEENKRQCTKWCEKTPHCDACSTLRACGPNHEHMKTWGGRGKNWHACSKEKLSVNAMWPGAGAAKRGHRVLLVSLGGQRAYRSDDGFEFFCEDYFSGRNRNPKVLCISSFAKTTTRSRQLSDNIAQLAVAIKKKSGVKPKLVLIGKSMGACKLHHAATGVRGGKRGKLKNMNIDLFVGIDMSCSVDRHFQKGEKDALFFTKNVKNLFVFYQEHPKSSQTSHRGIYVNGKFNPNSHTNVNKDSFDVGRGRKTSRGGPICRNVDHYGIDDCDKLRDIIYKLVLKEGRL